MFSMSSLSPRSPVWRDLTGSVRPAARFLTVNDHYVPNEDGTESQVFISNSYDATSHFETTCLDVLDIFRRGFGCDFDFSKVTHTLEDDQ